MSATTRVSAKGQIVIPKDVREALGLHAGQELDIVRMGNGVLLKPVAAKSGRTTDQIVAGFRALYRHEGAAVTIDEMNAAVDAMFAEQRKGEI